ncbi:hypothetical protein KJA16_00785 [Patescibacteria group bacterium]|nr:hypothetical protein [Patescibacteria group bacterium]
MPREGVAVLDRKILKLFRRNVVKGGEIIPVSVRKPRGRRKITRQAINRDYGN